MEALGLAFRNSKVARKSESVPTLLPFSILLTCVHDENVKVDIFRESNIENLGLSTSLVLPSWSVLMSSSAPITSNINPLWESSPAKVDLVMLAPPMEP